MGVVATKSGLASLTRAPHRTHFWDVPDAGIPLEQWHDHETDPLRIWKTQPEVRNVVGFAAAQVAQLPWHVFQRVGDSDRQRRADSPAERVWDEPMPFHSGFMFKQALATDALLYDRWAAIAIDEHVMRLPARFLRINANAFGWVTSIRFRAGDVDVDLTDAPLMIGWGWTDVKAGGISPLETLSQILEESRRAVKWRREQWEGRPRFAGLLRHPTKFKDSQARDRFTVSWRDWMSGVKEGTPILEDGLDWVSINQPDPDTYRDIEGRKLTAIEVCAAFHIPPEMVGVREGNFSNMQAFRSMLYGGPTLGPLIEKLQQSANRLISHFDDADGLYLEISREAAMNGSLIEQARVLQTMTGRPFMAAAEARARLNLPHKEGTDELVTPLNVLVGGQASPTDSGSQNERVDGEPSREQLEGA